MGGFSHLSAALKNIFLHAVAEVIALSEGKKRIRVAACRGAFREHYRQGKPVALEPLMLVSVEGPSEYQGEIIKTLMQRRGIVVGSTEDEGFVRVDANVPLAEMFGYATVLRSATQGKAEFSMEFERYAPAPRDVAEELVQEYQSRRAAGSKTGD